MQCKYDAMLQQWPLYFRCAAESVPKLLQESMDDVVIDCMKCAIIEVGTTIAVRKLESTVLLAVDRMLQSKNASYLTFERTARFPKLLLSTDRSFAVGSWGLMAADPDLLDYEFPKWIQPTLEQQFETVAAISDEIRVRALQTFSAGLEQFLKARAEDAVEGKHTVGFIVAGRIGDNMEVHVVTVFHSGNNVSVPVVEVEVISEGDYMAGQTAAINKVLADDQSEIARFGTAYGTVRNALAGLPDLPKELLEDASQLLSFVALEALADPTRVGGGYTFAWTTGEEGFRIATFEPLS